MVRSYKMRQRGFVYTAFLVAFISVLAMVITSTVAPYWVSLLGVAGIVVGLLGGYGLGTKQDSGLFSAVGFLLSIGHIGLVLFFLYG